MVSVASEINLRKANEIVDSNRGYYVNLCELFPNEDYCTNKKLLMKEGSSNNRLGTLDIKFLKKTSNYKSNKKRKSIEIYYLNNINNKNLNEILIFTIRKFHVLKNINNVNLFLDALNSLLTKKLGNDFDTIALQEYINNKNYSLERVKQLHKELKMYSDNRYTYKYIKQKDRRKEIKSSYQKKYI
jgi:hypothetical protein